MLQKLKGRLHIEPKIIFKKVMLFLGSDKMATFANQKEIATPRLFRTLYFNFHITLAQYTT